MLMRQNVNHDVSKNPPNCMYVCYRNEDTLLPRGSLGPYPNFTLLLPGLVSAFLHIDLISMCFFVFKARTRHDFHSDDEDEEEDLDSLMNKIG